VWLGANYEFNSSVLRITFSSFITPKTVFDVNMNTLEKTVLKQQEVPFYDASKYTSRRIFALAADSCTLIPISMVYRTSIAPTTEQVEVCGIQSNKVINTLPIPVSNKPLPMLLYGYGSYGACIDPSFDYKRIALLDRGVIFAVAHIRGLFFELIVLFVIIIL
jgi:oligopeptidase B